MAGSENGVLWSKTAVAGCRALLKAASKSGLAKTGCTKTFVARPRMASNSSSELFMDAVVFQFMPCGFQNASFIIARMAEKSMGEMVNVVVWTAK